MKLSNPFNQQKPTSDRSYFDFLQFVAENEAKLVVASPFIYLANPQGTKVSITIHLVAQAMIQGTGHVAMAFYRPYEQFVSSRSRPADFEQRLEVDYASIDMEELIGKIRADLPQGVKILYFTSFEIK